MGVQKIKPLLNLSDLKKGQKARITGFKTEDFPAKFLEMGILPGEEVEFKGCAPFNGPFCIALCKTNCLLALRKSEAESILVEFNKTKL